MMTEERYRLDNFSKMLISVLAHDLRQPFSTLILVTDMFKNSECPLSDEELRIFFGHIRDTAVESVKLLDGLVTWMKSQDNTYVYQAQPWCLHDLINEANNLYVYNQAGKGLHISNAVPQKQLVYADREMLQFINRNILSNATKYSPLGGTIKISSRVENNYITVAFEDQGIGIREDQLQGIFNIQDTKATNGDYTGAGIALNICQNMIQQANGKLWVESTYGKGTIFYYSLPLEP